MGCAWGTPRPRGAKDWVGLGTLVLQDLMWESHMGKGKLEKLEEEGGKEGRVRPHLLSRFLLLMCPLPFSRPASIHGHCEPLSDYP